MQRDREGSREVICAQQNLLNNRKMKVDPCENSGPILICLPSVPLQHVLYPLVENKVV